MKRCKGWRMSRSLMKCRTCWTVGCDIDEVPHSPTLTSLHLRYSSFSNSSAPLPMSQLILQPFRCFTYAIGTSPTSQPILQHFRRFIYATTHYTILPPLHLRHRSFYNPSVASPVTGTSRTSPGEPPMHRRMNKQCVVD